MLKKDWVGGEYVLAADLNANFEQLDEGIRDYGTAGETITAGQAVAIGFPTTSDLAVQNSGVLTDSFSSTLSHNFSQNFNVGSGSNRKLVIQINIAGTDTVTLAIAGNVTYGGVNMTQIHNISDNVGQYRTYLYELANPTSGNNAIAFSATSGNSETGTIAVLCYALNGAGATETSQSSTTGWNSYDKSTAGTPQAFQTGGMIIMFSSYWGDVGSSPAFNVATTNTLQQGTSGVPQYRSGVTPTLDTGNGDQTIASTGSTWGNVMSYGVRPSSAVSAGVIRLARADNYYGGSYYATRYIGIARNNANDGQPVEIAVAGKAFRSGMSAGNLYYLSNTPGSLSTSAGTNSIKIGKATSSTTLVLNPTF